MNFYTNNANFFVHNKHIFSIHELADSFVRGPKKCKFRWTKTTAGFNCQNMSNCKTRILSAKY